MTDSTIQIHKGNLLQLPRGIMVHGCNCLGVMGAGFALYLSNQYPSVLRAYEKYNQLTGLHLGDVLFVTSADKSAIGGSTLPLAGQEYATGDELPKELVIANAMTQQNVGGARRGRPDVDYDAIGAAFERVRSVALSTGLPVHFPLIGCGLAGGKWEEVAPRIEASLGPDIEKHLWVDDRGAKLLGI